MDSSVYCMLIKRIWIGYPRTEQESQIFGNIFCLGCHHVCTLSARYGFYFYDTHIQGAYTALHQMALCRNHVLIYYSFVLRASHLEFF